MLGSTPLIITSWINGFIPEPHYDNADIRQNILASSLAVGARHELVNLGGAAALPSPLKWMKHLGPGVKIGECEVFTKEQLQINWPHLQQTNEREKFLTAAHRGRGGTAVQKEDVGTGNDDSVHLINKELKLEGVYRSLSRGRHYFY